MLTSDLMQCYLTRLLQCRWKRYVFRLSRLSTHLSVRSAVLITMSHVQIEWFL